jgi:filamentous hemagglutinin
MAWKRSPPDQCKPFQSYLGEKILDATELSPANKTFVFFREKAQEALSVEALNTLGFGYIIDPGRIYGQLKRCVDAAADYDEPRMEQDLEPDAIQSKTIHLAVPIDTSPAQWLEIRRAQLYGRGRDVNVLATRIIE